MLFYYRLMLRRMMILDTELYKHFGIIGPPSIMFFDVDGVEASELSGWLVI